MPVVGSTYRVVCVCNSGNQVALNIKHARVLTVSGTPLTLQQIVDAECTSISGKMKDCLGDHAFFYGLSFQDLLLPLLVPTFSKNGAGQGTGGSDNLPYQVCGLVRLGTGLTGKKNRGRVYVPFPYMGADDDGGPDQEPRPSTDYVAAMTQVGIFYATVSTITVGGGTVTLSYGVYKAPTFVPFNSYSVRPDFATQRRRGTLSAGNTPPF